MRSSKDGLTHPLSIWTIRRLSLFEKLLSLADKCLGGPTRTTKNSTLSIFHSAKIRVCCLFSIMKRVFLLFRDSLLKIRPTKPSNKALRRLLRLVPIPFSRKCAISWNFQNLSKHCICLATRFTVYHCKNGLKSQRKHSSIHWSTSERFSLNRIETCWYCLVIQSLRSCTWTERQTTSKTTC